MRTVSAFIANHVEARDSMLYVSGGFPEWWTVPTLSATVPIGVGLVIEVEPAELGTEQGVKVVLRAEGGPDIAAARVTFNRAVDPNHIPNSPYYISLAMNLLVTWTQLGAHEVVVSTDDDFVMEIVRFGVKTPG